MEKEDLIQSFKDIFRNLEDSIENLERSISYQEELIKLKKKYYMTTIEQETDLDAFKTKRENTEAILNDIKDILDANDIEINEIKEY